MAAVVGVHLFFLELPIGVAMVTSYNVRSNRLSSHFLVF